MRLPAREDGELLDARVDVPQLRLERVDAVLEQLLQLLLLRRRRRRRRGRGARALELALELGGARDARLVVEEVVVEVCEGAGGGCGGQRRRSP